jgi:hypothetical protein
MTDTVTANGHDTAGGLAPPVPRPKDPTGRTGASRSRRYRQRKANRAHPAQTLRENQTVEKANDFKGRVTVARDVAATLERPGSLKN